MLDLDLAPLVRAREQGLGVKFGNVSPEYPVITFRTRPPRKNNAPRLDSESMTSVNCGSRPHHCRTTSRVAADQRAWPTTGCSTSPAHMASHRIGKRCPLVVQSRNPLDPTGNVVGRPQQPQLLPET